MIEVAPVRDLRPYLAWSAGFHGGLALAVVLALARSASLPEHTYRIDFIGPSAGIANRVLEAEAAPARGPAAPPAANQKIPPLSRSDDFRRRPRTPLPRPSVLSAPERPEAKGKAEAPSPPAAAGAGQGPADASVTADMPDFPYPWYISQIRSSLWSQWSSRMPAGGGEALVAFILLPSGAVTDLRVESSSGDAGFDYAAVGAVQDAGPFPPMPRGFREPFLKVHVSFRSQ